MAGAEMNTETSQGNDYAQDVLVALRQIQDTPGMQAEAASNPESTLNRLGLSGIARHAVAFAITAAVVMPSVKNFAHPNGWWQ
jgi:hypothetical protein